MTLAPGTTLGAYQITAKIGEGGMGEVYRARDTKLDRDVALKVLPEAFTADPDRLARFEREAKVLASLNHPNIGGIHGIEDRTATKALVLELVEGPTLADRIKQGPIPIDDALPIARQIAEALEAAHEQGVIHRDLKPANIKVRPDGTVKVLDFGLAKAFEPDSAKSAAGASISPTISLSAAATQMGVVIGTAAYMSPEQASGKVVDKRGDVWAFGVVLYEMLAGRRAVEGEDVSHTLAAVLMKEIDWERLPAETPDAIRALLGRCLERDPRQRLRDVGEARIVLDAPAASAEAADRGATAPVALQAWQRPRPAALVAVVLVALGAVGVWLATGPSSPQPARITRFSAPLPPLSTRETLGNYKMAISPDGMRLVFAADDQLYLRTMDRLEFTPLRGTDGATEPFFSPSGEWIGFWADGQLKKVAVTGGAAVTIADSGQISGATWGDDDTILFNFPGTGIARVSGAGGIPEVVVPIGDNEIGLVRPQLLPGGEWILFSVFPGREVAMHSLVTGERRLLLDNGDGDARYVPTGHLVYVLDGTLFAMPFDVDTLSLTPGPIPLVEGIRQDLGTGVGHFDVALDGSLAYWPAQRQGDGQWTLGWVDREGRMTALEGGSASFQYPRLSPDGRRIAVAIAAETSDIWIYDIERRSSTRLTDEGDLNLVPVWSPDGREVTYMSNSGLGPGEPGFNLFREAADGSGRPEPLLLGPNIVAPGSWSSDGTMLAYHVVSDDGDRDLALLRRGEEPSVFQATEFSERAPRLSPDGQWLAYISDQTGEDRIYVQPFPDGGAVLPISTGVGTEPVWSRDGSELFFREGNRMMRVEMQTGTALTAGPPELLFEGRYAIDPFGVGLPFYDVAPDGRFLMIEDAAELGEDGSPPGITVVLNWFDELRERVPVP